MSIIALPGPIVFRDLGLLSKFTHIDPQVPLKAFSKYLQAKNKDDFRIAKIGGYMAEIDILAKHRGGYTFHSTCGAAKALVMLQFASLVESEFKLGKLPKHFWRTILITDGPEALMELLVAKMTQLFFRTDNPVEEWWKLKDETNELRYWFELTPPFSSDTCSHISDTCSHISDTCSHTSDTCCHTSTSALECVQMISTFSDVVSWCFDPNPLRLPVAPGKESVNEDWYKASFGIEPETNLHRLLMTEQYPPMFYQSSIVLLYATVALSRITPAGDPGPATPKEWNRKLKTNVFWTGSGSKIAFADHAVMWPKEPGVFKTSAEQYKAGQMRIKEIHKFLFGSWSARVMMTPHCGSPDWWPIELVNKLTLLEDCEW